MTIVPIEPGYLRVTEVLQVFPFFAGIDEAVLSKACDRGTSVHEAIAAFHQDDFYPLSQEEAMYFISYKKWLAGTKFESSFLEKRLYDHHLKITGCIDMVGKFPGTDDLVLIDFKTTAAESDLSWKLQGTFYYMLALRNGIELSDRLVFLKLDKHGELPKVCEYKATKALWNVCVSALNCYKYFKGID